MRGENKREFICYWFYVGWWAWSLGISFDISSPNLEIHLPLGFIKIGWEKFSHD